MRLYASFFEMPARAAKSAAADLVDDETISFTISVISLSDILCSGAGATTITIPNKITVKSKMEVTPEIVGGNDTVGYTYEVSARNAAGWASAYGGARMHQDPCVLLY